MFALGLVLSWTGVILPLGLMSLIVYFIAWPLFTRLMLEAPLWITIPLMVILLAKPVVWLVLKFIEHATVIEADDHNNLHR